MWTAACAITAARICTRVSGRFTNQITSQRSGNQDWISSPQLSTKAGQLHTATELAQTQAWGKLVKRLQSSSNERHRRQLLLGFHATEHYPVFLPLRTLRSHAHILGATESGKTSRTVLPLLAQLIRLEDKKLRGPIVVMDLKGERYLFNALRKEAANAERTFRYFTNEQGQSTHVFNPIAELRDAGLSPAQVAEVIRAALNLEHGTGYGEGFFSSVTRGLLGDLFNRFPDVTSFAELEELRVKYRPTLDRAARERETQAYELISTLQMLARRPELNLTPRTSATDVYSERIAMARAIEQNEVIYFFLRTHLEEAATRFIASLALECLYVACYQHNLNREDATPSYVFIDEFQIVAGRNFQIFMQQARSSGLALVLSNQSRENLDTAGLLDAVDQNTAYRQFLTVRTPHSLHFLEDLAGETVTTEWGTGDFARDKYANRFARNDLITLSAREDLSLSFQAVSRDYSQFDGFPIPLRSPHHISETDHRRLSAEAWPPLSPATLQCGEPIPALESAGRAAHWNTGAASEPPAGTPLAKLLARIEITDDGYTIAPVEEPDDGG